MTGQALTRIAAAAVALLKAVVPPLAPVSAVPPTLPVVWSQARKASPGETCPTQLAFATKRT